MSNFKMTHRFIVKELSFLNKGKVGETFQIQPLFSRKIDKLSDNEYEVAIKVELKDTIENPFPFDLTATVALITKIEGQITENELNDYLNNRCISILFPYLRASVTSVTSAALMTPLVLPIIDASTFVIDNKLVK